MGSDLYGFAGGQGIPGMQQFMHAGGLRGPDSSIFALAPDTSNDPLPPDVDQNEL